MPNAPRKTLSTLAKTLLAFLSGLVVFSVIGIVLTTIVRYKPYGVPDNRREEYEKKVAYIVFRDELLSGETDLAAPHAIVDDAEFDFGLLEPESSMSHVFKIKNIGRGPLALSIEETTCKCTTGRLENETIPPGEEGTVTLVWNTGQKQDEYTQKAMLRTNDPVNERIELTVTGTIRADLQMTEKVDLPAIDPAEICQDDFVIYSQLHADFQIVDVRAGEELHSFAWTAEPIGPSDAAIVGKQARSAWKINFECTSYRFGKFSGNVDVDIRLPSKESIETHSVRIHGRARSPIAFWGPEIHRFEGLDMGTLDATKEHEFRVGVRVRGAVPESFGVLDVQPSVVQAELRKLEKEGEFQLVIRLPRDCRDTIFNRPNKRGYVQVGNVDNPEFSEWMPLYGAVVTDQ